VYRRAAQPHPRVQNLVRRIRKHFDAIIAAVQLGLSNSRLEGINAKIRLIQRRGYGIRDLDSLTASIYLCLGGITITLPTETERRTLHYTRTPR
jgi:transposase